MARPPSRPLVPGLVAAFYAAVVLLFIGIGTPAAEAAGITVDSTTDAVDAQPGDGVCATAEGVCTLRAAVQEANASAGPHLIKLPSGTYELTIEGRDEDGAATGDLDVMEDMTLQGVAGETTIDGGGLDRVVDILGQDTAVEISGITVRNGESVHGGGVRNEGTLVLTKSAIEDNRVVGFPGKGAGIFNLGTLRLNGSAISGNVADGEGGGIMNEGTLVIEQSAVEDNRAPSNTLGHWGRGAGIFNLGTLRINASTLSGNIADSDGGAIYTASGTTLELLNVTISGNTAGHGGGVFHYGATSDIQNVTIVGNVATGAPAGGYKHFGGAAVIKNSIIAKNSPQDCFFEVDSAGHNLESGTSCNFSTEGDQQNKDPQLGPLAENGGPTLTHAPLEGSPVIDAGSGDCSVSVDQRGAPRPVGPSCDIGAYESDEAAGPGPTSTVVATATAAPPTGTPTPTATLEPLELGDILVTKWRPDIHQFLAGWEVKVFEGSGCLALPRESGLTGDGGLYLSGLLEPGPYSVSETLQPGWTNLTATCVDVRVPAGGRAEVVFRNEPIRNGDVDGSTAADAIDASLILRWDAGLLASLPRQERGDVNGDGAVDSQDAALILQFVSAAIDSLPIR